MSRFCFIILCLLTLACSRQEKHYVPIWDKGKDTVQADGFDLQQIRQSGDLIALTLSGPQTYYEYQGRSLGLHFLMAEQFANHLGVRLRMDVCRDTTEMLSRLQAGDADLIAFPLTGDSLSLGWQVGSDKEQLAEALQAWYKPSLMAETAQREQSMLSQPHVRRRVYAPMLSRGNISHYDALFRRYSRTCGWDWRLIAAQCYQESTFDPMAESWAGAKGLMQIMPFTADHLGLARTDIYDPEKNVAAACRYIAELNQTFSDIHELRERQRFVLASYNGGSHHIRDAMRLAERDGLDSRKWSHVSHYVLKLSDPLYYRDTLVHHGYMRGRETVDYVDMIQRRYQKYLRSAR